MDPLLRPTLQWLAQDEDLLASGSDPGQRGLAAEGNRPPPASLPKDDGRLIVKVQVAWEDDPGRLSDPHAGASIRPTGCSV